MGDTHPKPGRGDNDYPIAANNCRNQSDQQIKTRSWIHRQSGQQFELTVKLCLRRWTKTLDDDTGLVAKSIGHEFQIKGAAIPQIDNEVIDDLRVTSFDDVYGHDVASRLCDRGSPPLQACRGDHRAADG